MSRPNAQHQRSRYPIIPAPGEAFHRMASDVERRTLEQLRRDLPHLVEERRRKTGRPAITMRPCLLIRGYPGDCGFRPVSTGYTDSPDIWVYPGEPAAAPPIPGERGSRIVEPGHTYTVYGHVWNVGIAPVVGAVVEFHWSSGGASAPNGGGLIGWTTTDLASRVAPGCHRLVKCPRSWSIDSGAPAESILHLFVRVWAVGDPPASAQEWRMWEDRHVAQRPMVVRGNPT